MTTRKHTNSVSQLSLHVRRSSTRTWYARWCIEAHGAQPYGKRPYQYHLRRVADVAIRFGLSSREVDMLCWAHDVLEDTDRTRQAMLAVGFPIRVVDAVEALSDEEGVDRHDKKAKTLPKIKANRLSLIGKLCDRIANVEEGKKSGNKKFFMYKEEHHFFKEVLFDESDSELLPLWQHLENLFETGITFKGVQAA